MKIQVAGLRVTVDAPERQGGSAVHLSAYTPYRDKTIEVVVGTWVSVKIDGIEVTVWPADTGDVAAKVRNAASVEIKVRTMIAVKATNVAARALYMRVLDHLSAKQMLGIIDVLKRREFLAGWRAKEARVAQLMQEIQHGNPED